MPTVNLDISEDLKARLGARAEAEKRTLRATVLVALEEYLDRRTDPADLPRVLAETTVPPLPGEHVPTPAPKLDRVLAQNLPGKQPLHPERTEEEKQALIEQTRRDVTPRFK